jgi:arylsulfatase A-like enzyme
MTTTIRNSLALACLSVAMLLVPIPVFSDERPNVLIIITADQNGYGSHGDYPGARVPAQDRLKETSVTFEHAYTAAPVSGPSRAAFFSGLYPHATGSYRNGSDPWHKTLAGVENLPELFKRSGYSTFGAGNLFHAELPDEREATLWDNDVARGGPGPFPAGGDLVQAPGDGAGSVGGRSWGVSEWSGPDEDFPDTTNADRVIEFLAKEHDKPFFMVYGLWRPRSPYTAPRRFFDLYDADTITLPPGYREGDLYDVPPGGRRLSDSWGHRWLSSGKSQPENWKRILHGYLAATSFADWNIGRVVEALDDSRHADDTIVIFLSDNGYHLGEKNHFEKATLWEQSARVPATVRIPGNPNNGRVVQQPIVSIDFFATLADYCALEKTTHEPQGLSLRPLLENPRTRWKRPAITTYGENQFSARNERYRYIRYSDGGEELYDHRKDPHEFINLADKPDYRFVISQFRRWIPEQFAEDLGGRNG